MPKLVKFCLAVLLLAFAACENSNLDLLALFKKKEVVEPSQIVTPAVTPTVAEKIESVISPTPFPSPTIAPSPVYIPTEEKLPSISSLIKTLPKPEIDRAGNIVRSNIEKSEKKDNFSAEIYNIEEIGVAGFPELKKIFSDKKEKWKRRYASATALSRLRYEEIKKLLMNGLKDDLSVIRIASMLALKRFPHSDVVDALHEVFNRDKGMIVRSQAAKILGEIADPRSITVLAKGLNDKRNFYKGRNLWVRRDIVYALGKFKSNEPVPILVDILNKKDMELYETVVASLEKIINPVSTSEPFLKSLDQKVKWWISWWEANKNDYAKIKSTI